MEIPGLGVVNSTRIRASRSLSNIIRYDTAPQQKSHREFTVKLGGKKYLSKAAGAGIVEAAHEKGSV
jgi:hypothetical protein